MVMWVFAKDVGGEPVCFTFGSEHLLKVISHCMVAAVISFCGIGLVGLYHV